MKKLFMHCLAGLMVWLSSAQMFAVTGQPLIVNIDNPNFRKLNVAVPDFLLAESADRETAEVAKRGAAELVRLLNFSALFSVRSPDVFSGVLSAKGVVQWRLGQQDLDGVDLPQWRAVGIESLTLGEVTRDNDTWTFNFRTIDTGKGQLLVGKRYSKVAKSQVVPVVRRYADQILKAYTGKQGIFSSRLTFVGRRSRNAAKQIFISDFDGSNVKQITNSNAPHLSPSWSRDGRYVTFTSFEDGPAEIFMYDTKTGQKKKMTSGPGLSSGSNWGPDDRYIAFTGAHNGNSEIYVMSPKGRDRKILIAGDGLDVDPTFSPDGKWMAFVSGRFGNPHIFRASLEWNDDKVRVNGDKRLTYAGWYNATPAWSPESDKLAFAGYDKDINRFDMFMMNPDGTQMERLTLRAGDNERPSWSPNGQLIIFQSSRGLNLEDIKGTPRLFIMNRDGSNQRLLDTGLHEAQQPAWGPQVED
ncbi:MAG: Tol-Pal system beta propeller repeat protein TolB [Pseudomonadota bacterium]|jgi:TolB protein